MTTDERGAPRPLDVIILSWRDLRHPEAGGSEVYIHEIARRWVAAGHRVTIVTSRPPATARREVCDGVLHRRAGGRLTVYLHGLTHVVTRGSSADVVVDVINGLPFATPLVRRRNVVALVHHVHQAQWRIIYPGFKGRLGWFLESRVTPTLYQSAQWVTVSQTSRRDLERLGVDHDAIQVVPNGLAHRRNRGRPHADRPHRVVVLARLVPHKQLEHVLQAAVRLRAEVMDFGVDVVGSGWWESELRELARTLGVQDVVVFHGRVDEDRRDDLLAQARVMVLPSVKEGWGLAVSEAAAQGTPTVGYRASGGLTESVIDGVTGWLVDDFEGLVAATRRAVHGGADVADVAAEARRYSLRMDWDASALIFEQILAESVRGAGEAGGQRSP
jgi:glycosyltransferase involved in cell wall biosynthesis